MLELALIAAVSPVLGAIFGWITAYIRSNKALKTCLEAKKACNDEIHAQKADITALKTQVLIAEARIVALEVELEKRVHRLESLNGIGGE